MDSTIIVVVFLILILGGIILYVITNNTLNKTPTIELVHGKLNDEKCSDSIEEAIKELKIVNKWQ